MEDIMLQSNHVSTRIKIRDYQYLNDEDMIEVNILEGVVSIGERSFANCKNLKKIILPVTLEEIGPSAFSGCESLEEIVLPKNIKKLCYRAFGDCKKLKKIVIPEGVQELEWGVFAGCQDLEEIELPNSITKMDKQLFLNCKKLRRVKLPKNITELPDEFFRNCENLDIVLPETITELGKGVFSGCIQLTHFPTKLKSFGDECFKNCRAFKNIILNKNISFIPNDAFNGCINLESISYEGRHPLNIGEAAFKRCKSLKSIPHFVKKYNKRAFEGCEGIEEITITDSHIPEGCFKKCKGLKKINDNKVAILSMGSFAFSGCTSLTDVTLNSVKNIPNEAFSNCHNLKSVKINSCIDCIGTRAFYRCYNLSDFFIPDSVTIVKKEALRYCNSLAVLHIPLQLKRFEDAAFANMASLEYIDVPYSHHRYFTSDHKILIKKDSQSLVLYSSGLKDESYTLKNYVVHYDHHNGEVIRPITSIGPYAFAGSHNLKELTICGCTGDIEISSFDDCPKLKKLVIEAISLGTCPFLNISEHGQCYVEEKTKYKKKLPFDTISFTGDIVSIYPNGFLNFGTIKKIDFSTDKKYYIGSGAFSTLSLLEDVDIPDNITGIEDKAFPADTTLHFSNGLAVKNLTSMKYYSEEYSKAYMLFTLPNAYYIQDDDKVCLVTKKQMEENCVNFELIIEEPLAYYEYMKYLDEFELDDSMLKNGILISNINYKGIVKFFTYIKNNKEFALNIIKNSDILKNNEESSIHLLKNPDEFIAKMEILKKLKINNTLFFNKLLLAGCSNEDFESLLTLDIDLLESVLIDSHLLHLTFNSSLVFNGSAVSVYPSRRDNSFDMKYPELIEKKVIGTKLLSFIQFIKDNHITNKNLMNEQFISNDSTIAREFMLYFNNNMKRLIKYSGVFSNRIIETNTQNFKDLLILLKISGALEDDCITSQKAVTYITEKIFLEDLPNGEKNPYRIVGDDIHRIFNFKNVNIEFNPEFASFFLENYKELYEREISCSGIIERIYRNFAEISKTSTSDHGSQRHLKVTLQKCLQYLSSTKFDGVNPENEELAYLIGCWFDSNRTWENAWRVYKESLDAPRNIFAPLIEDEDGNFIFDMDPCHDLKEISDNDYTFEWLPKQSYDNLLLGKFCNCCAHIEGAGQGIMRASMILDCCQNLVVRYHNKIIAKSIIYVNREKGYAVFNTIEGSLEFTEKEELECIYEAFMRGATAFFNTYNKNYPQVPLNIITIGTNRNKVIDFLNDIEHPEVEILEALMYGDYSLYNNFRYAGDWSKSQRLVLKR